jgi:beta-1,4-mannosyl-glycoprotein beta-1,4-N-acetylglucosaminyltransferase
MIYDIFTFNDELEILELRLNIHNELIDKFVIVESNKTFRMRDKPSVYLANKSLFKQFEEKIIHIFIEMIDNGHPFYNDYYQKSMCYKSALEILNKEDICYISDLDEILNTSYLLNFQDSDQKEPMCGVAKFLHYFINVEVDTDWYNGIICNKNNITNFFNNNINHLTTRDFRDNRANKNIFSINKDYGYHYTYLLDKKSGTNNIYKKLQSHSHTELDHIDINHINYCVKNLLPLNPQSQPWKLTPFELDNINCPLFILNNINTYQHLIYNEKNPTIS